MWFMKYLLNILSRSAEGALCGYVPLDGVGFFSAVNLPGVPILKIEIWYESFYLDDL